MSDPRLQRWQPDGPQAGGVGRVDDESQPRDLTPTYRNRRGPFPQPELRTGRPAVTVTTDSAAGRSPAEAVQWAVSALANGRMVIVTGDAERGHQADLLVAAEAVTAQQMAFIIRYSTGIVCAPMKAERCQALRLPQMTARYTPEDGTALTVSVDNVAAGTGVSAAARTRKVHALAAQTTVWDDLRRPGHILPLRARDGGVLPRAGRAEAAVDLTLMAGLSGVGVFGEIVADDGSMLAGGDLADFAGKHRLPMLAVTDLVRVRRAKERLVERVGSASMPTASGVFRALAYRNALDATEHLALVLGDVAAAGHRPRRPGAAAQRVPHRRRFRLPGLRLRCPPRTGPPGDRRRGVRCCGVSAGAGGAGHGPRPQRRGQLPAGTRPGRLRLRDGSGSADGRRWLQRRRSNTRRPWHRPSSLHHPRPGRVQRPRRTWSRAARPLYSPSWRRHSACASCARTAAPGGSTPGSRLLLKAFRN